jgi:hypothetical protein
MGRLGSAISRARGFIANAVRGITRCAFALATLGAWVGILAIGQGEDVIRRAVERAALDQSFSELASLAVSTTLLGLSIWYAMRCLLGVQMAGLPMTDSPKSWSRTWLPRLAGGAAVGVPAWVIGRLPPGNATDALAIDAERIGEMSRFACAGFVALAAALLLFLWRRTRIFGLAHEDLRDREGAPLQMAPEALLPAAMVRTLFWALALMCLCSLLLLALPLSVPRVVGSAPLVALALAGINLFGSFVLTFWPLRGGLPPLAPWVLGWAIVISPLTDNHESKLIPADRSDPAVAQRPDVGTSYQAWLAHHAPGRPTYVVATEGGGSRAAFWTAAVLERLSARDPGFKHDVFAISAVSGGSVGAAFWVAGMRSHLCGEGDAPGRRATVDTDRQDVATRALTTDFLSPAVNYLLFADLMQRFVPYPMPSVNRSRGLEEGWQRAFATVPGRPLTMTIDRLYANCDALPQLLLNSTASGTGQRDILTHMRMQGFVDVLGAGQDADPSTDHQPLSGLMLQSARFPVVSPAGSVTDLHAPGQPVIARLVDGGYFDNSGIVTALEAIEMMKASNVVAAATARQQSMAPTIESPIVLIVIADKAYRECAQDPDSFYCKRPTAPVSASMPGAAGTPWVNEIIPLVSGLYNVRDSHLRQSLFRALSTTQVAVISRDPADKDIPAPTGWALSRGVTNMMAVQADQRIKKMPLAPPPWPGPEPAAAAKETPRAH